MSSRFAFAFAVALALLAQTGCRSRTQLMFGVITDLRAPDALDEVELVVQRSGVEVLRVPWQLPGVPGQPYILPGSYGVYSEDGSEPQIAVSLTGMLNGRPKVERKAIVSLVREQTLFLRLGLVAGCVDRHDCAADETCVESQCKPILVDSRRLPKYVEEMEKFVDCASGTTYVDTGTQTPVPTRAGMGSCTVPGSTCEEATCYLPTPDPVDDLGAADLAMPDMAPPPDLTPILYTVEEVPAAAAGKRIGAVFNDGVSDTVWAVGEGGLLMTRSYFAGSPAATAWVDQSLVDADAGIAPDFRAIAVPAESSEAWLGGAGTIMHYTGGTNAIFEPQIVRPSVTIDAILATGGEVWFVGRDTSKPTTMDGTVWHWDGAMLLEDINYGERPALRAVAELDLSSGMLIAAGEAGAIFQHPRSGNWTSIASRFLGTTSVTYTALATDRAGTIVVGTSDGRVLVLPPGAPTASVEPRFSTAVAGVWLGEATSRIYAASTDGRIESRPITGGAWVSEPDIAPRALTGLTVVSDHTSATRIIAVGANGLVWSAPGTREILPPNPPPPATDGGAPSCFPSNVGDFCSFDCDCSAPMTCLQPSGVGTSGYQACCAARGALTFGSPCLTTCDCAEGQCYQGSCSLPP